MCPATLPGYDTNDVSSIVDQLAQYFDAPWCAIGLFDFCNSILHEHLLPNDCLCLIPLGFDEVMVVTNMLSLCRHLHHFLLEYNHRC